MHFTLRRQGGPQSQVAGQLTSGSSRRNAAAPSNGHDEASTRTINPSIFIPMVSAAAGLIFDTEGQVLLMREGYGRERYGLPGGVIEQGESPRATAVREVKEECGLDVRATELVAIYHLRTDRSEGLRFFFRCQILGGEPLIPETGEVAELMWAPPTHLPTPTTESAPYAIQDCLAGRKCIYREIDTRDPQGMLVLPV
jgi:8-oxo-dGTP diphosphatase